MDVLYYRQPVKLYNNIAVLHSLVRASALPDNMQILRCCFARVCVFVVFAPSFYCLRFCWSNSALFLFAAVDVCSFAGVCVKYEALN